MDWLDRPDKTELAAPTVEADDGRHGQETFGDVEPDPEVEMPVIVA